MFCYNFILIYLTNSHIFYKCLGMTLGSHVAKRIIADVSSMSSTSSAGHHGMKKSSKKLKAYMAKRYKR